MRGWNRWWLAGLLVLMLAPLHAKAPEKNDVRILIDISGSMKQNDPHNLRRPALRMLVGLLQPGTRASVWTFAKWTNPLVPLAEVTPAWKKRALAASRRIGSPGMFTNIERVLESASRGWSGAPVDYNRHLVLLTDGMVDVSRDKVESAASRRRILEKLLPRLKELGIHIHTIALSAKADHELMKRLSGETGGWYQQVDNAEQLKRVFLKVFEQVGRPEGVPLKDNRFTVDASVREATILLFRRPGSPDPVLISPAGDRFTDSDLVAGVAWYKDQGYDLITISSPARGEWSLQADVDPDNRVMIVTDLKLQTSELPAHLAVGEPILLSAHLSNKGRVVRRKAFLRLLDVGADAISENGRDPLNLNDKGQDGDERAGDGRYSVRYSESRPASEIELLFSIESPTFMREKRYRLAVHEPLSLETVAGADGPVARVEVDSAVMDAASAQVTVWQGEGKERKVLQGGDGKYTLADPQQPVFARIEGRSRLGNRIERRLGPVYAPGVSPPKKPAPEPAPRVEHKAPEKPAAKAEASGPEPGAEKEEAAKDDWVMPAVIFGVTNLLLIAGGLGIWWFLRRRRGAAETVSLEDEFSLPDEAPDDDEPETTDDGAGDETLALDEEKGEAA